MGTCAEPERTEVSEGLPARALHDRWSIGWSGLQRRGGEG